MDNGWYPGELEATGHLRHLECPLSVLSRFLSLLPLLKLLIPASVQSPQNSKFKCGLASFCSDLSVPFQASISPPQALCSCRLPAVLMFIALFTILPLPGMLPSFITIRPGRTHLSGMYSGMTLSRKPSLNTWIPPLTRGHGSLSAPISRLCAHLLEVKSLRAGPWSYLILCRSDSACAHRHSVNVCRTDLVPNSRGSAQMLGSDSHQYVSLFVTETSTRETKHHTWRVGKLRFITPASPEELTLQALSPEQRGYRVFIDRL